MKRPISVGAYLTPLMILERVKTENTVTDRIVVTAVGETQFLAKDVEGKEHRFYAGSADEYYCIGMQVLSGEDNKA